VNVNRYVLDIVFRNGAVTNSGHPAIYLESGTTENQLLGSQFSANGYCNYPVTDRVRSKKANPVALREAIAVD